MARSQLTGSNLGIQFADLWWQGYSGLTLKQAKYKLRAIAAVGDTPSIILFHCGGNDLGNIDLWQIRQCISNTFKMFFELFPGVRIIWSEILPRLVWRYSDDAVAMERSRKRINSYAGKLAISTGGSYLRHPVLSKVNRSYFKSDGVHLSVCGNEFFLAQIRKGILGSLKSKQYIA